ncbi:MAG: disulfide bond formation protein B [Pseudomonadota bacterium]
MSSRLTFGVSFLACVGLMGYALYAEHVLELYPCPLCVFQRIAVIALGVVSLVGMLHNPYGAMRWFYAGWAGLAANLGALVAGRHLWLQSLPADQVPSCGGASLDYMLDTLPLADVLKNVLTASGECAEVTWQFLGLSMPAWVLIAMLALEAWIVIGLLLSLRRDEAVAA